VAVRKLFRRYSVSLVESCCLGGKVDRVPLTIQRSGTINWIQWICAGRMLRGDRTFLLRSTRQTDPQRSCRHPSTPEEEHEGSARSLECSGL